MPWGHQCAAGRQWQAQAARGAWAGGGGGKGKRGAGAKRPNDERLNVAFRVPGQEAPVLFKRLKQSGLDDYLMLERARGFDTGDGSLSRSLEDLPEGGTVDLVLSQVLWSEEQVRPWACMP